eukprot:335298-Chlamydomonas_euryale.AAC.1
MAEPLLPRLPLPRLRSCLRPSPPPSRTAVRSKLSIVCSSCFIHSEPLGWADLQAKGVEMCVCVGLGVKRDRQNVWTT